MKLRLFNLISRLFCVLTLIGCSSESIPSTPTSPAATQIPATSTIAPTATAALLPTVALLPTFSFGNPVAGAPTTVVESPFEFVAALDELLPGSISAYFRPTSDGSIWMIAHQGIVRLSDSSWTVYLPKHEGHFVGMDTLGRAWSINPTNMVMTGSCLGPSGPCFINPDMDSISAWDGTKWTRYSSESGWTNFSVVPSPGPDFSMAELDGQIWISTSVDVRVFDGSRWRVIKPEEIGLTPPYSLLTIQAFAGTKEIWVIGCKISGPGPNRSVIYGYDGNQWENRSVPEDGGCLLRVQEDRQGNVWLTADETLWRFTHATEEWIKFTPPAPDSSPNYIRALALNTAGEPWLTTMSSNRPILYHLQNGVWSPIIQFNSLRRFVFVFIDSGDRVWIPTLDGIYQIVDDHPVLVSHLDTSASQMTMDSTGRIWAVGRDSSSANDNLSLWVVNP